MTRLQGKTAVITGGNSGIGRATALRFAREGANVAVFGRNPETLESVAAELGDRGLAVRGDVTNRADLENLFAQSKERFGAVDVVFANAGLGVGGGIDDISEDGFRAEFDTNVLGMVLTAQTALPHLAPKASVILTSSVVDEMPMPGMGLYAATKAATRSFAKTLALELAGRGVRVNTVAPGPIETEFIGRMGMPEEQLNELGASIQRAVPMQRFGTSDEVANVALFLASDEASYVTGAEFVVDGGMLLQAPSA